MEGKGSIVTYMTANGTICIRIHAHVHTANDYMLLRECFDALCAGGRSLMPSVAKETKLIHREALTKSLRP